MINAYWSLLSTHGVVLYYVAIHPDARVRNIAAEAGLTERRVLQVLCELRAAGFLWSEKVGRCNRYIIPSGTNFRHPVIGDVPFQVFLDAVSFYRSGCEPIADDGDAGICSHEAAVARLQSFDAWTGVRSSN